ncbi:MAG TPA: hypothetical protein VK003_08035, partial [Oceanobacillus sp.]|nr:hypothetical protein [Oceanobacillus sp.]
MRRSSFYILIMGLLIVVALFSSFWFPNPAISQSNQSPTSMFPITMYGEEPFRVVGEIGRALPRRIVYDATSEQFAIVDVYNRLLLMDAHTYQTRYVLHSDQESDETNIAAMQFSHDGRYLAVINDLDVELWDTQTGTLAANLVSPGSPRYLDGPLAFSSQDEVLVFYGVYPAPPALRRSENDVVVYPWVWHLPAARGERASTFPGGNAAQIMYDYRSGFALTPNDHILASLPSRLVVMDALTLEPLYEIPTQSYANDALQVWTSVKDGKVYVLTGASNVLLQIDTANRTVSEFPLYVRLSGSLRSSIQEIATPIARGALWRAFLDERQVAAAREVSLIDVVQPLDPASGGTRALLYVRTGSRHELRFSSGTYAISQMTLSPDGATLLTRESRSNGEVIAAYDIASGNQRDTLIPSLRSPNAYDRAGQNRALAYDSTGETFLSDFQRYDADTFEVLAEDLRYSFRYDRFFFGRDPGTMVTISGREWRVWDVATNSVLRREHLVHEASNIRAISPDAYR